MRPTWVPFQAFHMFLQGAIPPCRDSIKPWVSPGMAQQKQKCVQLHVEKYPNPFTISLASTLLVFICILYSLGHTSLISTLITEFPQYQSKVSYQILYRL